MSTPAGWLSRSRDPAIAGVAALVLSLIGVATPSVDFDGAATVSAATRSVGDLWMMLGRVDAVHGAYDLVMHPVFAIFGYSPVSLRVPSAVFVGVAAAFVVVLARQWETGRFPLLAGLVFAIIPRVTWMGIEGRSGALATLLVVVSTVLLVRATRSTSFGWWVGYTVAATAGCYVFAYTWLLVLSHGIAVAIWSARARTRVNWSARPLVRWALAALVTSAAIIPLVVTMFGQRSQVGWIAPFGLADVGRIILNQWFMDGPVAIIGWILVVLGVMAWARGPQRWTSLPLVFTAFVFPTFALVVTSIAVLPLWVARYPAFCTPFLALLIAAGIVALRRRWLQAIALVLFVALALIPYVEQRSTVAGDGTDWKAITAQISQSRDEGVTTGVAFALLDNGTTSRGLSVAYPDTFDGMTDVSLDRTATDLDLLFGSDLPLREARLDDVDEVFVLSSEVADLPGWRVSGSWEYVRMVLTKLERNDP